MKQQAPFGPLTPHPRPCRRRIRRDLCRHSRGNHPGNTEAEALAAAKDALETALDFYFEDKRMVPMPSKAKRRQHVIELPASLSAKVLLLNEMVAQNVRSSELARRLKTTPQEVNRLTNVRRTTRIDGIAAALQALGKHLDMRVI